MLRTHGVDHYGNRLESSTVPRSCAWTSSGRSAPLFSRTDHHTSGLGCVTPAVPPRSKLRGPFFLSAISANQKVPRYVVCVHAGRPMCPSIKLQSEKLRDPIAAFERKIGSNPRASER